MLALTRFASPDPWSFFGAIPAPAVGAYDLYDALMPEVARPGGNAQAGGDVGAVLGRYAPQVTPRRQRIQSFWSGPLVADAAGEIHLRVPIDEAFAGRLRLMAVADQGVAMGACDAEAVAHAALQIESSWPRVLAPGDQCSVPVRLRRLSGGGAGTVVIKPRLTGPLAFEPPQDELRVALDATGSAEVRLALRASAACGVAHARIVAELGADQAIDVADVAVRPPAPSVVVGGEVEIASGAPAATVALPSDWLPGSITMSARVAPEQVLSIPQGLERLYRYPYGCCEQTVSAAFPLLGLGDLARAADGERYAPSGIAMRVESGMQRLASMQTPDGGIAMWPQVSESWPFGSCYAAHFLVEASRHGYAAPEALLRRLLAYLRRRLAPGAGTSQSEQAYAAYVLALAGEPDLEALDRLERGCTATEAAASFDIASRMRVAAAWALAGHRERALPLLPENLPDPELRSFAGDIHSPVADRALTLLTLIALDADASARPRLARSLADSARWTSTQDIAWALLALGAYQHSQPKHTSWTTATLEVDGAPIAAAGASAHWCGVAATLSAWATGPAGSCGYLSWTACGVPLHPPPAASHGLRVERELFLQDGSPVVEPLHSGDLVVVRLEVQASRDCGQLVVEDLLPGGLEVENPRLQGTADQGRLAQFVPKRHHGKKQASTAHTGTAPAFVPASVFGSSSSFSQAQQVEPGSTWPSRVEVRDDRVVVMGACHGINGALMLVHSYLARAVTAGTFSEPPLRAECMYDSSINGTGAAATLVVAPRQ